MNKNKNQKELDTAVQQIYDAINNATRIADKHNIPFGLNVAYGMGGYYHPTVQGEWDEQGWNSSSSLC